jgi:hypothetical protein
MKLGVFSNENLEPGAFWSNMGPPVLHPLAANPRAKLIAPGPFRSWGGREFSHLLKQVYSCDTLFWFQGVARPDPPIHTIALVRGIVRRSALVADCFPTMLGKIGLFATMQRLDPCFIAMREGYLELKKRFPLASFEWLPFGVATEVFDSVPGERPIFAYCMGHRYERLHEAVRDYCAKRNLVYKVTTGGQIRDRMELGRMVGSSKYLLVAPSDLATPERAGGFSPFVQRYFEGLSAGSRLLGVLPKSGEYDLLLPREAMCIVKPDCSDLEEKLDNEQNNVSAFKAVEAARDLVRREHSWKRRSEQIWERLNSGKPTGFPQ